MLDLLGSPCMLRQAGALLTCQAQFLDKRAGNLQWSQSLGPTPHR